MKVLRIVSCILACACVAAVVPVGLFLPLGYIVVPVAAAALFAVIMLFAKNKSDPAPPEQVSFMNSEEKNAEIRAKEEKNDDPRART